MLRPFLLVSPCRSIVISSGGRNLCSFPALLIAWLHVPPTKPRALFSFHRCATPRILKSLWRTAFLSRRGATMKKITVAIAALLAAAALPAFAQNSADEGGRVLGLEKAWNHAIEAKDTKALDQLLASTFVAVEIDGSASSKSEFLASIKAPEYQPSQAVNEDMHVQVYGNAAVVVGIFRIKGVEKGKPYVHRERFIDTWIKQNQTWQCVASSATLITAK
jgi:ketosteroid isomerase-like protein